MASVPVDPNTSELLTDFDIADVVNWDDQNYEPKDVDFAGFPKQTVAKVAVANEVVLKENKIGHACGGNFNSIDDKNLPEWENNSVKMNANVPSISLATNSFDTQDEGESSGLATLRELSSEVAKQAAEVDLSISPQQASSNDKQGVAHQSSGTSIVNQGANPKNTQFLLVGGQKVPVGERNAGNKEQDSLDSDIARPFASAEQPSSNVQSIVSPTNLPLAQQELKEHAVGATSPMTQQHPTTSLLKVPTNKLALKGQIVRTADQKLMLVTEVGGKKVGYLIRQQASQSTFQSSSLTGNVGDTKSTNGAGAVLYDPPAGNSGSLLNSTISTGKSLNVSGGNMTQSLPSQVALATSQLITTTTSLAPSSSPIDCKPDTLITNTIFNQGVTASQNAQLCRTVEPSDDSESKVSLDLHASSTTSDTVTESFTRLSTDNALSSSGILNSSDHSKVGSLQRDSFSKSSSLGQSQESMISPESEVLESSVSEIETKGESSDEDSTPLSAVAASLKAQQDHTELPARSSTSPKTKGGRNTPKKEKAKKRGGRGKKKKDDIPKPVPAYQQFFKDIQASLRQENPHMTFGEISKLVSQSWEALSTDKKLVYQTQYDKAREEYTKKVAAKKLKEEQEDSAPLASLIGKDTGSFEVAPASANLMTETDQEMSSTSSVHDESTDEPHAAPVTTADIEMCEADSVKGEQCKPELTDTAPDLEEARQLETDEGEVLEMEIDEILPEVILDELTSNELKEGDNEEGPVTITLQIPSDEVELNTKKQKKGSKIREPKEPRKKRKKKIREPILTSEPDSSEQVQDDTESLPEAPVKITVKISEEGKVVKLDQPSPTKTPQSPPAGGLVKFKIPIRRQDSSEDMDHSKSENSETSDRSDTKSRHGPRLCVRDLCDNPAKTSRERGSQYCSNDCLVVHCRNVFNSWVEELQAEAGELSM